MMNGENSMNIEKLEKDGKVAVLISPNYGAGWSTWADDEAKEFMLFDANLVNLVMQEKLEGAEAYVKSKFPNTYTGGISDLRVKWVDKGSQFIVDEYDGYESIKYNVDSYWITA